MAIIDLQRRLSEAGRIRIGHQVPTGRGKSRPAKLETFRLTSPNRALIEEAARIYGGEVKPWEAPSGNQWECITRTDSLPVVVPPTDMCFSQFYELWSGGGCVRRCDGLQESISDGQCLCDPSDRECAVHTRLSVMLRDLRGLGVWRLDTGSFYAGSEIQGAMEIVKLAASRGQMLPAVLRLEQRMIKRANEQTKRFAVPVLDLAVSPAQLLGGGQDPLDAGTLAIEPPAVVDGNTPLLTPVPETVPQEPVPSIAEQATGEKPKRKPRKNAAQKIPPTGVKPRTAAQAAKSSAGEDREPADSGPPPQPVTDEPEPPRADEDRAKLNRHMHALFRTAQCESRDDRLTVTAYLTKKFDIQSSNDLSVQQLQTVVDKMTEWDRDGVLAEQVNDILNQAAVDQWAGAETTTEGEQK